MKKRSIMFLVSGIVIVLVLAIFGIFRGNNLDKGGEVAMAQNGSDTIQVFDAIKNQMVTTHYVHKTPEEWKAILGPKVFHILREKGTERAFTGKFYDYKEKGIYVCAACGNHLFSSSAKFHSGTGWPSFTQPVNPNNVILRKDRGLFLVRTEVLCAHCGSHLGHVFDDGPPPTGKRYCINSLALHFIPEVPQK